MATDHDAVKQTIDILTRSDLLDEIVDLMELFLKRKIVPFDLLGYDLYFYAFAKAKKYNKAVEYGSLALNVATTIDEKVAIMGNLSKNYLLLKAQYIQILQKFFLTKRHCIIINY